MRSPRTPRPVGRRPIAQLLLVAQSDGQELLEPGAGFVQDPQCAVAGIDQRTCFFNQVAEQDRQFDICLNHEDSVHQAAELGRTVDTSVRHPHDRSPWQQSGPADGSARWHARGRLAVMMVVCRSACSCSMTTNLFGKASGACSRATKTLRLSVRRRRGPKRSHGFLWRNPMWPYWMSVSKTAAVSKSVATSDRSCLKWPALF